MAKNISTEPEFLYEPVLPDESQKLHLGEAAIGGMVPTAIIIILFALLRIVKAYQLRQEARQNEA